MKVCIDPGHGGSQPGAVGYFGTKEKDITLQVALQLRDVLKTAGVDVVMTRESDKDVRTAKQSNELQARCDVANNSKADVFISIHCNASNDSSAHGTETWYYPKDAKSKTLAQFIQTELVKQIGLKDRGVKQGNYYVTRYTKMPAVLVELAFISNPEEEVLLRNKAFQRKCAVGIANGVLRFLGMPLVKEESAMKDVPQTHWAYKYIKELYDLGIVQGDEKGYFYPDKPATKAEVATMIARLYEKLKGGK